MSTQLDTREALFAVMEQIAEQREAAKPIVEELVARGAEEVWDREIPESWRTAGFVQELSAAAGEIRHSDPVRSLSLQQLALAVATNLAGAYPSLTQARLEGIAWMEIGLVHCFQSAYDAALRAYDAAQLCLGQEGALCHDAARVMITRAGALNFARHYDDALKLAEKATPIFRSFGDQRRIAIMEFMKALVYHYRGELHTALAKYEELTSTIENMDDPDTLARLYLNLGAVYAELDNSSRASIYFQRSRALHADLGNSLLADKADWGLARALLGIGEFTKAMPILRRLRDVFLDRQMPEDAGEVALDIVEALISTNQIAEARELIEQVVAEFRSANLNEQAITALAYLRDLLQTTAQARQAVKHVRSYVEKLRTEPAGLFVPLPEERFTEQSRAFPRRPSR